jgi:exopolyphosphatase/guanosine-5'-triphosphate,3'-diphosphate pyrophosphatase
LDRTGDEYGEDVRVAAVDLGTNTTRLLVADVEHGLVEEVVRREVITHMGESVDRRRILLPTAVARVRNVLVDYRREAEGLGAERVLAVGTSAVGRRQRRGVPRRDQWSYAFTTRLLDGGEEAELMLRGVMSDRAVGESTLVVDIGGGSTELVMTLDGKRIAWAVSTEAGSVRLTERFLAADPPTVEELETCAAFVRTLLRPAASTGGGGRRGGHGDHRRDDLDRRVGVRPPAPAGRTLRPPRAGASPPCRARSASRSPASSRPAPVIVAGLVVLHEIAHYGLAELEVSERDLLHGAALAARQLQSPRKGSRRPAPTSAADVREVGRPARGSRALRGVARRPAPSSSSNSGLAYGGNKTTSPC